ncbi:hypothetical protein Mal52_11170 [Symmachiella dynata]|uniref:Uncharacterized protein n=1 Tax=Symmachiella dynata TaxID=2527995 RepID=A0A517ZJJ4_9PLAN|nr:hypothetical protein [Symmachiella dynata]QDU42650.1 hypothetical protein Mal52_11170 [Symmachiella dynata]
MPILRVLSLICHEQEDNTGHDDAYIRINGSDFWGPKPIHEGQPRVINKDYLFNRRAKIGLYESDDWDPDDFLGEQMITKANVGQGEIELPFKEDDANYTIYVEVLADNKKSADAIIALNRK